MIYMGLQQPTFKQKLKRFWMIYFKDYVRLTTISRDPVTNGYRFDTELVMRKDVPVEAVHNSGDKHGFTIDRIGVRHPYRYDENGFSAIDLNLWLESNEINDCLAFKWDGFGSGIESKHVIIIAGVLIAGLVVYYVLKGGFM